VTEDEKFREAAAAVLRQARDRAVERARDGEDGFSVIRGDVTEIDGIPQAIINFEWGAAWLGADDPENRAPDN
jgi:hypothetical protein